MASLNNGTIDENVPPFILHEWRATRGNDWVAGSTRVSVSFGRYTTFTVRRDGALVGKARTYPALVGLLGGLAGEPVWTIANRG